VLTAGRPTKEPEQQPKQPTSGRRMRQPKTRQGRSRDSIVGPSHSQKVSSPNGRIPGNEFHKCGRGPPIIETCNLWFMPVGFCGVNGCGDVHPAAEERLPNYNTTTAGLFLDAPWLLGPSLLGRVRNDSRRIHSAKARLPVKWQSSDCWGCSRGQAATCQSGAIAVGANCQCKCQIQLDEHYRYVDRTLCRTVYLRCRRTAAICIHRPKGGRIWHTAVLLKVYGYTPRSCEFLTERPCSCLVGKTEDVAFREHFSRLINAKPRLRSSAVSVNNVLRRASRADLVGVSSPA